MQLIDRLVLFLCVDTQLSPFPDATLAARAATSLYLSDQLGSVPLVQLGLGRHGLKLLGGLAHVKPFDLRVDSV